MTLPAAQPLLLRLVSAAAARGVLGQSDYYCTYMCTLFHAKLPLCNKGVGRSRKKTRELGELNGGYPISRMASRPPTRHETTTEDAPAPPSSNNLQEKPAVATLTLDEHCCRDK